MGAGVEAEAGRLGRVGGCTGRQGGWQGMELRAWMEEEEQGRGKMSIELRGALPTDMCASSCGIRAPHVSLTRPFLTRPRCPPPLFPYPVPSAPTSRSPPPLLLGPCAVPTA